MCAETLLIVFLIHILKQNNLAQITTPQMAKLGPDSNYIYTHMCIDICMCIYIYLYVYLYLSIYLSIYLSLSLSFPPFNLCLYLSFSLPRWLSLPLCLCLFEWGGIHMALMKACASDHESDAHTHTRALWQIRSPWDLQASKSSFLQALWVWR